jgi:hypothetical protein
VNRVLQSGLIAMVLWMAPVLPSPASPQGGGSSVAPDRGVGIISFALPSAPMTGFPFADTLVIHEDPTASSPVLAHFLFQVPEPFIWAYTLEANETAVTSNALEYDYEMDGLPIDSAGSVPAGAGNGGASGGAWVRVVYGIAADGAPRTGWVRHIEEHTEVRLWADELPTRSLFFLDPEADLAFYDGPGGDRVTFDLVRHEEGGRLDYRLDPVETNGRWMKARVVTPDGSCRGEEVESSARVVWIEYLDQRGRPRVWYYTRGC